jgi:cytochrome c553
MESQPGLAGGARVTLTTVVARLMGAALFAALSFATHAAPAFEDTIAQRTLACTACHGKEGRAGPDGYYPRLAGKPAGYLYNQLINLRDGRRHYPLMAGLVQPLTDAYLWEMAQYFSALDLPYRAPVAPNASAADLQRGQQLATKGDAAKNIPACTACHGAALMGVLPDRPALLGLPRDYLTAQLGGWQTGQRAAHAPDCMAQIAKRLSPADTAAAAAWLSAQTVPSPAKAIAPSTQPSIPGLPTCGSAPAPQAALQITLGNTTANINSAVVRGAYLARAGNCMGCHTAQGQPAWAGGRAVDTPFGRVFSSNLTSDKATGLGNWTADDFWRALNQGISKNNRLLYPAFPYPYYTQITRADADDLWAYLQTLAPVNQPPKPHELRWPYSTQLALRVWRWAYFSAGPAQPVKTQSAEWMRGAYLVQGLGHCSACHAPRNALGGSGNLQSLAGSMMPLNDWYAPSLVSRAEAGLGDWSVDQITTLLQTGRSDGQGAVGHGAVNGPMVEVVLGSTQHLSAPDVRAIAVYLKDLAAREPKALPPVTAHTPPPAGVLQRGESVYTTHCAGCHGEQGQGVAGAYPRLAGNRAVNLPQTVNLIQIVLNGGFAPATQGNPRPFGMPPYVLTLTDADIAAVLTHVRSSWGNTAAPVSELQVTQLRNRAGP